MLILPVILLYSICTPRTFRISLLGYWKIMYGLMGHARRLIQARRYSRRFQLSFRVNWIPTLFSKVFQFFSTAAQASARGAALYIRGCFPLQDNTSTQRDKLTVLTLTASSEGASYSNKRLRHFTISL